MHSREPDTDATEAEFLVSYDPRAFPPVAVTADVVLLTIHRGTLSVVLVQRRDHPSRGQWAIPGGFIRPDEDLDAGAARELREETGLDTVPGHLEQLRTYGSPGRDPRMRVISVAYLSMMPELATPFAGTDAADARLWPVSDLDLAGGESTGDGPALSFDHHRIIADALERARSKIEYTPLAASFLQEPFTIADLRRIYEAVWGTQLHAANFRRKVLSTPGFVVGLGEKGPATTQGGRAAELYRAGHATLLHPAMLRPDSDLTPQQTTITTEALT